MNEIHGPKGFRQLLDNKTPKDAQEKTKMFKKWYVLHRLLHHAKQVVSGQELQVWIEDTNPKKQFFMDIRNGVYSFEQLNQMAQETEAEIQKLLKTSTIPESAEDQKSFCEEVLLHIRYKTWKYPLSLQTPFPSIPNPSNIDFSKLNGDPLLIVSLENRFWIGVYVAHSDLVLSNFQTVPHLVQIESNNGSIPFYEIGKPKNNPKPNNLHSPHFRTLCQRDLAIQRQLHMAFTLYHTRL